MVSRIAQLEPVAPPGSKPLYQSMTHGWLVGEIVRRTDPKGRTFGQFVRDELGRPLDAPDLWIGVPDSETARVAPLTDDTTWRDPGGLYSASLPRQVALIPEVFERPDIRAAEIPAVGGVFTARSCARLWAMLAESGALRGRRLLSAERVKGFNRPRDRSDEPDAVMMGQPMAISEGGYWLGALQPLIGAAKHPWTMCHPGYGNSIGWADPKQRFAAAICHNRMSMPSSLDDDWSFAIAETLRQALGLD
jgi:CubicO group peptidase (beta-lactamase class C family)